MTTLLKFLVRILQNTDFWEIKVGLPYKGELTEIREVNEGNSKETDSKSEKYVLAKRQLLSEISIL